MHKDILIYSCVGMFMVGCSMNSFVAQQDIPVDEGEQLEVPFTSQAPDAVWTEPWLNACEETSVLMVDYFYKDDTEISREEARAGIKDIFAKKRETLPSSKDESLETIKQLVDSMDVSWTALIKENPTEEELKIELENNRPIIVPVYAPKLGNPYYTDGGPDYHVLVLTGYNEETQEFNVHDPGTKFGEELAFSYGTIMDAIHDLNQQDYDAGKKGVLFTAPR